MFRNDRIIQAGGSSTRKGNSRSNDQQQVIEDVQLLQFVKTGGSSTQKGNSRSDDQQDISGVISQNAQRWEPSG